VAIPKLSEQELQAARKAATEARRTRALFKDRLRAGELSIGEALDQASKNDVLAHIKVIDLLKTQRRIGQIRAEEIMGKLSIAPTRRLRGLGKHQVDGIIEEFR